MDFLPFPEILVKTADVAFKTVSERVFQKAAEVTDDLHVLHHKRLKVNQPHLQRLQKQMRCPRRYQEEGIYPRKITTNY